MRRVVRGWFGVALLLVTAAVVSVVGLAPTRAHSGGTDAAPSARVAGLPAAGTAQTARTPIAAVVDAAVTPVPASTQLVSPKPFDYGLVYFDGPGGQVAGTLPLSTWGGPTVRPVVKSQRGWLQIRLDTRPNGSTAWVFHSDVAITTTAYRIVISVSQRNLTLYQNGWSVYSAPVGVGRPQWPTPLGPSFVDAVYTVSARQQKIFGPVALVTGSHSNVFTEFDGGDGTVAIHGYPSDPATTAGVASSHGCIRANPQTVATIAQVPAGTPIDFVA